VALGAGITPEKIVMSGVGKADWELDLAIARGIFAIQLKTSRKSRASPRARRRSASGRA